MNPLTATELRGIWCTALLPLNDDDTIDEARLCDDLDYLIAQRPHGIYVHGSAGEFITLTDDEFKRISALTAERCEDAGLPFQIGASHPSGQQCCTRIRRAVEFAPSAIQVTVPDWLPLSDHEIIAAMTRFHDLAEPVPLVLYNPPHAKTQVRPEMYATLADRLPRLIGVKVAGGDEDWLTRMRTAAPGLAVFVAGHRLAREAAFGARGAYSNIACLSPRGALRWYADMTADPAAAADLDGRVQEFFRAAIRPVQARGYGVTAIDKLLAAVGGWSRAGTRVRWPHDSVPGEVVATLRDQAARQIPELLIG